MPRRAAPARSSRHRHPADRLGVGEPLATGTGVRALFGIAQFLRAAAVYAVEKGEDGTDEEDGEEDTVADEEGDL